MRPVTETYARWDAVPGIGMPCADIVLHADPTDLTVRLRFSGMRDGGGRDLLIRFGHEAIACTSHDEFVHPWHADTAAGDVPRLDGQWSAYAFPLLRVSGSRWLASFGDGQILDEQRAAIRHFRFVSLDNTVDVLTAGDPSAEWIPAS
jgi:hypothetical protein